MCVRVSAIDFGRYALLYGDGAHGVITRSRSYSPEALDPKVKHYSRMNFNLAELEANDVEPEAWPILRDMEGNLTEGTGYNFFMVTDGVIRTPTDSVILQGVSRGTVFDLAEQLDIPLTEEDLQPYDLYTADEAFFASTSFCVLPVTQVDKRDIGDGKPGPRSAAAPGRLERVGGPGHRGPGPSGRQGVTSPPSPPLRCCGEGGTEENLPE